MESFDVIGGWRDHYRATGEPKEINGRRVRFWPGPAVDPSDKLEDGRSFKNIDEFKKLLAADKDQLARSLAAKLLTYATGAAPTRTDKAHIESIVTQLRAQNYGFKSLIHQVVQNPLFQTK